MSTRAPERPPPRPPRPYRFPPFHRAILGSGFQVLACHLPGRSLGSARLLLEAGSANEPRGQGGVAALAGRALTEGTERHDAGSFSEAADRLGAQLDAEAGWDIFRASLIVPMGRMEPALELLAEAARSPAFPEREVQRHQQERLNEIIQERAEPGSRAHLAFLESVYTAHSAYARPLDGTAETVSSLTRDQVESFYHRFATPASATLVLAGDLNSAPWRTTAERLFGDWALPEPERPAPLVEAGPHGRVTLVHRPGSVQSQIMTGHLGLRRLTPDFMPVTLMVTILGGLFTSRLNLKLREEKGYTYSARAWFDFRRQPGPFAATAAVETAVTRPALQEAVEEIRRMHASGATEPELNQARDFLVGVLPLRFETPEAITSAIANLVIQGLPDDYYDTYRAAMESVTIEDVDAAARTRLRPDQMATVVVGDAEALETPLKEAGLGAVTVVEDPPQS